MNLERVTNKAPLIKRALSLESLSDAQAAELKAEYAYHLRGGGVRDSIEVASAVEEAVRAARTAGSKRLELRAMLALRSPSKSGHDQRLIELSEQVGDPELNALAHWRGVFRNYDAGDYEGFASSVNGHWQAAQACRVRARVEEANFSQAMLAYVHGDFTNALRAMDRFLESAPLSAAGLLRAWLCLQVGDVEGAVSAFRRMAEVSRARPAQSSVLWAFWLGVLIPLGAKDMGIDGLDDEAVACCELALTDYRIDAGYAGLGLLAGLRGRPREAIEYAGRISRPFLLSPLTCVIDADHLLGQVLAYEIELSSQAEAHYERAKTRLTKLRHRPETAWLLHHHADLLERRKGPGDRERAVTMWDQSLAIARETGMKPLIERVIARKKILKA
jgi:tetratricopeptide (TPR) repeat protein